MSCSIHRQDFATAVKYSFNLPSLVILGGISNCVEPLWLKVASWNGKRVMDNQKDGTAQSSHTNIDENYSAGCST